MTEVPLYQHLMTSSTALISTEKQQTHHSPPVFGSSRSVPSHEFVSTPPQSHQTLITTGHGINRMVLESQLSTKVSTDRLLLPIEVIS